ncbi:NDP-hexose 2,3-dehydratase [Nocardia sp. SYP-A9097]|nr:NDP-hexose 2,3-dehydratase [Nocardia sp. SYP-A9097]
MRTDSTELLERRPRELLRPRADRGQIARVTQSAATVLGAHMATGEVAGWFAERAAAIHFRVDRIPFGELDDWYFERVSGNLAHRSGRFFRIEGMRVSIDGGAARREWCQPIIHQPEVGILGILAKEFDGVLHFLMQAKMEPGNSNLLQLSPTVQATWSNYTGVHNGDGVKFLEFFTDRRRGRVLTDVLQSEHGAWFAGKSNRNMIVETVEDVPEDPDFRWLTFGQLGELLRVDNLVNMDARTVLSCCRLDSAQSVALHSDTEVLSWFTDVRSGLRKQSDRVPLAGLPGWVRRPAAVEHVQGRYFRVVAVSVDAGNREVRRWTQPLIEPVGRGVVAFLMRRVAGVPHVLVHARAEAGYLDTVELGATVQCVPDNYAQLPIAERPRFLDLVLSADPARIRYSAVHSEEGGRFLNAESRYLVVEVDETPDLVDPPPEYRWVSLGQLSSLVQHNHYVNVQARTLLACLHTMIDLP